MYKMMLVDDQEQVVYAMANSFEWNEMGVEISDVAYNGVEALDKIIANPPDIALVDIEMPKMDGLELIKRIREAGINTKIVILTGYSSFDYAKEAFKYNVNDYLLKPAYPEDIVLLIKKIIASLDREYSKLNTEKKIKEQLELSKPLLIEKFTENLIKGNFENEKDIKNTAEYLEIDISGENYRVIALEINVDTHYKSKSEDEKQYLDIYLLTAFKELLNIKQTNTSFSGKIAYFVPLAYNESNEDFIETISAFLIECKNDFGVSISVGVGNKVESLTGLKQSFSQAQECLKYKMNWVDNLPIFYEDIIFTEIINSDVLLYDRNALTENIKIKNKEGVLKCIDDFFVAISKQKFITDDCIKIICNEIISISMSIIYQMGERLPDNVLCRKNAWEVLSDIKNLEELNVLIKSFYDEIFKSITVKSNVRINRIFEKIIDYIHENYSDSDMSLTQLAKSIYMTSNYLSMIFTKCTNTTFKVYLTEYRMEKAKDLLLQNKYTVSAIANMVGYKKEDHFRKVFKSYTGCNPTEYMK